MLSTILIILLIGAFIGFIFSRRGNEVDGAVSGAKTAGCLLVLVIVLAVAAVIFLLSGI